MTTNDYWQHTILLQCSLHGVRNEFLQLCVELCRCYAPFERQLYYQEDLDIGQQQYLTAVPRRRQQEEVEEGCGEDARRKRQQEGGAVNQGSRDEVCLKGLRVCVLACSLERSLPRLPEVEKGQYSVLLLRPLKITHFNGIKNYTNCFRSILQPRVTV